MNNNHFYFGAQAGVAAMDNDLKVSAVQTFPGLPQAPIAGAGKVSVNRSGVLGEIFLGYAAYFSNFLISPEFSIGVDGVKGKESDIKLQDVSPDNAGTVFEGITNELNREMYGNLAVRFGAALSETFSSYVRLGLSYGRFEYKFRTVLGDVLDTSDKEWLVGFNPGVGFECKVINSLPLYFRGEYNYYRYATFKTKSFALPIVAGGIAINQNFRGSVRPSYHTVSLGFVYTL